VNSTVLLYTALFDMTSRALLTGPWPLGIVLMPLAAEGIAGIKNYLIGKMVRSRSGARGSVSQSRQVLHSVESKAFC